MKKLIFSLLAIGSYTESLALTFELEKPDFSGRYSIYRSFSGCGPQESRVVNLANRDAQRVCARDGAEIGKSLVPSDRAVIVHSLNLGCWSGQDSSAVAFVDFRCVPKK